MPRAGLWQRPNRRRHRVFTRPRAALSIYGEAKPVADHDLQPQDARVSRFIGSWGSATGQFGHATPFVRSIRKQAAAATACSNVMIEQCNPSLASLGERRRTAV